MKIDYNEIINLKMKIEELYSHLTNAHQNILNFSEDADCCDDEKIDIIHSYVKEYESKIDLLKSDFLSLSSENKKMESCLSQIKLLKKKRLTKIESAIQNKNALKNANIELDDMFSLGDDDF